MVLAPVKWCHWEQCPPGLILSLRFLFSSCCDNGDNVTKGKNIPQQGRSSTFIFFKVDLLYTLQVGRIESRFTEELREG